MRDGKKKSPTVTPEATPFFARFLESQEPEEDAEAKVSAGARRAQATAKSRGGAKKSAAKKSAAKKAAAKKSAGKKKAGATAKAVTLKYPSDRDEFVLYPYHIEAARRGPGSGAQTLKYPSDGDEDAAFALSYIDRRDAPTTARAKAKEGRVTITRPRRDLLDAG